MKLRCQIKVYQSLGGFHQIKNNYLKFFALRLRQYGKPRNPEKTAAVKLFDELKAISKITIIHSYILVYISSVLIVQDEDAGVGGKDHSPGMEHSRVLAA